MSGYSAEYETFFTSSAGSRFIAWIEEQRSAEHDQAERIPANAAHHAARARAYREIIDHIESVQIGLNKTRRSSSGADSDNQPD